MLTSSAFTPRLLILIPVNRWLSLLVACSISTPLSSPGAWEPDSVTSAAAVRTHNDHTAVAIFCKCVSFFFLAWHTFARIVVCQCYSPTLQCGNSSKHFKQVAASVKPRLHFAFRTEAASEEKGTVMNYMAILRSCTRATSVCCVACARTQLPGRCLNGSGMSYSRRFGSAAKMKAMTSRRGLTPTWVFNRGVPVTSSPLDSSSRCSIHTSGGS